MIELPRALADALVAHARKRRPNEVCGIVGLRDGRVVKLARARNAAVQRRTRFRFGRDGYRKMIEVERGDLELGIYHSHPASAAYPSPTDRAEMSQTWPDTLQLMVSLRHDGTSGPEINAYRIGRDGSVTVEDLRIVDDRPVRRRRWEDGPMVD